MNKERAIFWLKRRIELLEQEELFGDASLMEGMRGKELESLRELIDHLESGCFPEHCPGCDTPHQ
jgi:hypothetical protein